MAKKENRKLVIVTGLSGAGKTQTIRCLEDLGYFCVDNLPPGLIPKFASLLDEDDEQLRHVALVMDIRGGRFFGGLVEALDFLENKGILYDILFLDAADEILVRRYKETRRRHPMSQTGSILEGILEERKRLEEMRGRADKIIDTSGLIPQQLRTKLKEIYGDNIDSRMLITLLSFGFKYGIPLDADLIIDVRFLPNPHYIEHLRPKTGIEAEVWEYVMQSPATKTFLSKFSDMLEFLLPYYVKEGKSHLVVAVGCTGGHHRSVAIARELACRLPQEYKVDVRHRDIERAGSGGEPTQ